MDKIKAFAPRIAVFNGKGIYEVFSNSKDVHFGKQKDVIEGTDTVSNPRLLKKNLICLFLFVRTGGE